MLFNSYSFILLFLPIILAGYYLISSKKLQLWFLLLASLFFYCYWSTSYVFLLLFTVILDFYIARKISQTDQKKKRKSLLLISIISNLSILGFFKYFNFFAESVNGLFSLAGVAKQLPYTHLLLPIGISFYTFQSMSYVIDVYRRTSDSHANLLEFAGYVTLFPHQISGPLVRHNVIVPQLENSTTYNYYSENFWRGCYFFIFGLSKKMLIADRISLVVDPLIQGMGTTSNLEALLAMLGYTIQLYFDFSGYSDMAVGLGLMMNIKFPQNFNSPYKSNSITEFWQRWHISLSSWLRDYLYISLGGNREGEGKTYRNLFLTMAIGGLWHGASWTYVVWGCFHGVLLIIERCFKSFGLNIKSPNVLKWLITFSFINIGWVLFRSPNLSVAKIWLMKALFLTHEHTFDLAVIAVRNKDRFFVALGVGLLGALAMKNTSQMMFKSTILRSILLGFLLALCLMYMGEESPFLYFQF